jgi:hypothetical protein
MEPGWIDREDRKPVTLPGSIVLPGGTRLDVVISNVSQAGCQVRCPGTLRIGQIVRVELESGTAAEATVRWALQGRAGLRFEGDLSEN